MLKNKVSSRDFDESLGVLARAGTYNRAALPTFNEENFPSRVIPVGFLKKRFLLKYPCQHSSPRKFRMEVWGRETLNSRKGVCAYCELEKAKKTFTFCGACDLPIAPEDPVCLYEISDYFVDIERSHQKHGQVIGCLRMNCCPTGDLAGCWNGESITPIVWIELDGYITNA